MDELVGEWSSAASGQHPSTFEDEILAFLDNGDGWYQFTRPDYADISYFRWRRTPTPGRVDLDWHTGREIFGGVVTTQPPEDTPSHLQYQLHQETLQIAPPIALSQTFHRKTRTPQPKAPQDK